MLPARSMVESRANLHLNEPKAHMAHNGTNRTVAQSLMTDGALTLRKGVSLIWLRGDARPRTIDVCEAPQAYRQLCRGILLMGRLWAARPQDRMVRNTDGCVSGMDIQTLVHSFSLCNGQRLR